MKLNEWIGLIIMLVGLVLIILKAAQDLGFKLPVPTGQPKGPVATIGEELVKLANTIVDKGGLIYVVGVALIVIGFAIYIGPENILRLIGAGGGAEATPTPTEPS